MNEMFAIHYKGKLLNGSNSSQWGHTRKGRVYTTISPAKSFITRVNKWLISKNREKEINFYEIVRYVPEVIENKEEK